MNKKLILCIWLLLLFLSTNIISPIASSKNIVDNNESDKNFKLIMRLLRLRFNIGFREELYSGRYFYLQYRPPVAIQAYPDAIDLKYLNKTTFQIGGFNKTLNKWETMIKVAGGWSWSWFNPQISYYFEFIPPKDAPEGVWNVQFDPPVLIMKTNKENLDWPGAEDPFRTNVTIMLKPSNDPTYYTQDIVLKFNIIREEALDHLRILSGAPKWVRTQKPEYIEKELEIDPKSDPIWSSKIYTFFYNLILKCQWFLVNLRYPAIDKWIDSTVEVLVRVNKYHQAEIIPPLPIDIEPYEVKSIPVTIKNIGSHTDTFNFRVSSNEKNMLVTPPPAITLKPGEETQALVGVAAPKDFISMGDTTSIYLEAYSIYDKDSVFSNTIILSTVGVNFTGGQTFNFIILLIAILIIVAIFYFIIRLRRDRILKKPEKPWEIPEEKKYLEKLQAKNKKKYNETLNMMKDEYKSTLLWYKYYCDFLLSKKRKVKRRFL